MISYFKKLFNIGQNSAGADTAKVDYEITDLRVGYMLDYDLKNWVVKDVAIYTWDNGVRDFEYTLTSGTEQRFLYFAQASNLRSIYWKVNMVNVLPSARAMMAKGEMNQDFDYNRKHYHPAGSGCARVKTSRERYEMENWMFEDDNEESIISFNKYEDGSSDVYEGVYIDEFAIGNIIPKG